MAPIKFISDDVIELNQINVLWRRLGGLALALLGVGGLWVAIADPDAENRWLFALTSMAMAIGGYLLGYVSFVRINRAEGVVTKGSGWLKPSKEQTKRVSPKAIRVTINRSSFADDEHTINRLLLVHDTGELELLSSGSALDELRSASAALAEFLRVEQYEDRLHKLKGALVAQTGPGVEPTRTYVDRGETIPLPADVETDEDVLELAELKEGWC